jgi:hypothetical protein
VEGVGAFSTSMTAGSRTNGILQLPIRCNLHSVGEIIGDGTIDELVTDASASGHAVTARLVRDWTEAGLLDYPRHRAAGKGHGSRHALYAEAQRKLFLTLLHHRGAGNGITSLARIPVGIWMYWGDGFVPVRQVRRAMLTWIGDPRASLRKARETAKEVTRQLDNPAATPAARRELCEALADLAYTGRADFGRLERAVAGVFDAGYGTLRRAVGDPGAPVMTTAVIDALKARLIAIGLVTQGKLSDEDYYAARRRHLAAYTEYASRQQYFARSAPADNLGMYEPVTTETSLNACCGHLLTTIGLSALYPEGASRVDAMPTPAGLPWRSVR